MLNLLFLLPALLAGAVVVMSLFSGEAFNPVRWGRPLIVKRAEVPREYWAGVFVELIWLGGAIAFFIGMSDF